MDNIGNFVHSWSSDYRPGQSVYLLEDGTLLRTANTGASTFNAGAMAFVRFRLLRSASQQVIIEKCSSAFKSVVIIAKSAVRSIRFGRSSWSRVFHYAEAFVKTKRIVVKCSYKN